jgi:hypothetical protein
MYQRVSDGSLARLRAGERLLAEDVEWVEVLPDEDPVGMYTRNAGEKKLPWPYALLLRDTEPTAPNGWWRWLLFHLGLMKGVPTCNLVLVNLYNLPPTADHLNKLLEEIQKEAGNGKD